MAVNGVGPAWAPDALRNLLTGLSLWFFSAASWGRHDEGYSEGGGAARRAECDRKFLRAMLADAAALPEVWRMGCGCLLAWLFYAAVRLLGWTAFNYHENH